MTIAEICFGGCYLAVWQGGLDAFILEGATGNYAYRPNGVGAFDDEAC
jgi:hypothetical protein